METLSCFKAYDIRGKLGDELNEAIAYRIGRAYGEIIRPRRVVVGGDVRLSSEALKAALAEGLMDAGADVLDLGMSGTEEVYFGTVHLDADGGIEVTASHNPIDYNGMKLVRERSRPISGDSGLRDIQRLAETQAWTDSGKRGVIRAVDIKDAYADHMLSYIDVKKLKPLKLVVNSGNGAAGPALDAIEKALKRCGAPVELIKIHHEPDGNFPNGIPNPLLVENRSATADAVKKHIADMGVAWDGDFDRCFFFDEHGRFIEGYYIVGLLAEAFLKKEPDGKIIHDPRLTWNTVDIVNSRGGKAIQSKTGHAFIKERMRQEDAIYGGEMSAHHYFRDFSYCDSGMIPWLLVAELISESGKKMGALVNERVSLYPSSGEINRELHNPEKVIGAVRKIYANHCQNFEEVDGISVDMGEWRFNLRLSNTEPLIRLNVESKGNAALMKDKTDELLRIIDES
ncbi:phosphomannomutase CpsG [Zobellella aerophila]|uniref:phosphomannomutase n=1 Tax=Zobellella aerophila TaxID=870480 RepID=A0ABP6VKS6_9GAMM